MTALELLGYIAAALLLQIGVSIVIAVRKLKKNHDSHRDSVNSPHLPVKSQSSESHAWQGLRNFRVIKREFEDSAKTVCSFYLQPVEKMTLPVFLAGQFITICLHIEDLKKQKKIVTRCYSLSNMPGEKNFRISIKRALPQANSAQSLPGLVSNYFHDNIRQGDVISIRAPSGQFYIDTESNLPLVMIAGGIGITPLLSMLLWCIEHQPTRVIYFYCGVRNGLEHAFKAMLVDLAKQHANFYLNVVYSNPTEGDELGANYQHLGYVDIEMLRRTLPYNEQHFYVCGPSVMMESLIPSLIEWGVNQENIHYEAFGPASIRTSPITDNTVDHLPIEVKFQNSKRSLIWEGQDQNLLDFAERHSIAIEAGCRAGSCGSCETQVISGTVSYRDKPEYDIAPGYCLLCVGRPVSTLEIQA